MAFDRSIQLTETGRRLGHDLFKYRNHAASRNLSPCVREGFECAAATGVRPQAPDRFEKKWLQLRLSAWQRGRAFDESVTPVLLRAMDVAVCPITRVQLTHGERTPSDWSVDRLNNDGAYAANNLAVISTLANKAKGSLSFDEVLKRAGQSAGSDGLSPIEWLRMASLMLGPCFATRPMDAPCLPLAAPIPLYSVRLTMQQVQHVFTMRAASQSGKNLLIKHFKCASPTEKGETRLRTFAELIHTGLKGVDHPHDVWHDDRAIPTLLRWREVLDDQAWGMAGEISRQFAGSRLIPSSRLQSWAMESRGYAN